MNERKVHTSELEREWFVCF